MPEIHPATFDRFDDVRAILGGESSSLHACWCLTYRLSNADNRALTGEARPMRLKELCESKPAPGILAYVDGIPAGWIALGPRTAFERLKRSRTIPLLDDKPVWSIVCLVVSAKFRRQGVASALIEGAVTYAKLLGARTIEAYPVETNGIRINSSLAFMGTTEMFKAVGFSFCAETSAKSAGRPRILMRREV